MTCHFKMTVHVMGMTSALKFVVVREKKGTMGWMQTFSAIFKAV